MQQKGNQTNTLNRQREAKLYLYTLANQPNFSNVSKNQHMAIQPCSLQPQAKKAL
jgi:hypothetical protein